MSDIINKMENFWQWANPYLSGVSSSLPNNKQMEFLRSDISELLGEVKGEIERLEFELEEERQENASLRSGDDYERGAE